MLEIEEVSIDVLVKKMGRIEGQEFEHEGDFVSFLAAHHRSSRQRVAWTAKSITLVVVSRETA